MGLAYFYFYAYCSFCSSNFSTYFAAFESDKLKSLKPSGARRPLDPIEGAANLPDCPDLAGDASTPVRLAAVKRHVTPDVQVGRRLVLLVILWPAGQQAVGDSSGNSGSYWQCSWVSCCSPCEEVPGEGQ